MRSLLFVLFSSAFVAFLSACGAVTNEAPPVIDGDVVACTPEKWTCEDQDTRRHCAADGLRYDTSEDCAEGTSCVNGGCVKPAEDGDTDADTHDPDTDLDEDSDTEVESEPEAEPEPETEPEVEIEIESELPFEVEPEKEADGDTEREAEAEIERDTLPGDIASCAPRSGVTDLYHLKGTIVTPDRAYLNGEIIVNATTHRIVCLGEDCSAAPEAAAATLVCTEGVIMPGMLDPHNHTWYNTIPRWKHEGDLNCSTCNPATDTACGSDGRKCLRKDGLYSTRYKWTDDPQYSSQLKTYYNTLKTDHACAMQIWSEARQMIHGTTGVAGAAQMRSCYKGMVRNLDLMASWSGLSTDAVQTNISDARAITNDLATVEDYCGKFASAETKALLLHVAEGAVEDKCRTEFDELWKPAARSDLTMLTPQLVAIHSAGGTAAELRRMACADTKLVWSPRSNLDLYGQTADIPTALNYGTTVALGVDWTPSGSLSLLHEMRCAQAISDRYWDHLLSPEKLVSLATEMPARALSIDSEIGKLEVGYLADLVVIGTDEAGRRDPYATILGAEPWRIRLTFVGGLPIYGDAALVPYGSLCETLDVCGVAKKICIQQSTDAGSTLNNKTLAELRTELETALAPLRTAATEADRYLFEVMPLFYCPSDAAYAAERETNVCVFKRNTHPGVLRQAVPAVPLADDRDEDGVPDASDNCPAVHNPDQIDFNTNETGDACEKMSLVIADCPHLSDGTCNVRADSGGKSKPVAVRAPAFWPKALTLYELPTLVHPAYPAPASGTAILLSDVVVTAVDKAGFYVQAEEARAFAGLRVWGLPEGARGVRVGDHLDLWGRMMEDALGRALAFGASRLSNHCDLDAGGLPKAVPVRLAREKTAYLGMRISLSRHEALYLGIDTRAAWTTPEGRYIGTLVAEGGHFKLVLF